MVAIRKSLLKPKKKPRILTSEEIMAGWENIAKTTGWDYLQHKPYKKKRII